MCGIVGIASNEDCIEGLVSGLKNLEYRGYDSSGLVCNVQNQFSFKKSLGKISNLKNTLKKNNLQGNIGIAHTRWATHGKPSINNAHPFIKNNCALVHNGIIENYEKLINKYKIDKNNITSDTDSEIVAEIYNKLLHEFNNPVDALTSMVKKIEGTFALAFLVKGTQSIYATRKGSPLVLGISNKFNAISSDVLGLPDQITSVIFLEENDIVEINNSSFSIFNLKGNKVNREIHPHSGKNEFISKGKFKHFMQKEIFHQPESIEDTVLNFADKNTGNVLLPNCKINFNNITNLYFTACGTAYHACMIAKYWYEYLTKIPTSIDIASEYRYRKDQIDKNSIGIVVSQSGETMDTLECLKKFKKNDIFTTAIVNVLNSSIARQSDYILPSLAGPEIGVASTKAFTSQLIVLALFAQYMQQAKNISNTKSKKMFVSLFDLPKLLQKVLDNSDKIEEVATLLKGAKSIFYIGRGTMYPLALEGALKLKEITYKHCEGYAAGELKHGPLALIEKDIPVIALAPYDENFSKLLSNIQEIKARDGKIIIITNSKGEKKSRKYVDKSIILPDSNFITSPIIYALPIQMIAYNLAALLGTDIDQPRNLAKSVTVE
tara:strand:- start:156 stop:1973 length:1818 start_codon:yes stop_codon:yes gene_type:complete